MEMKSYESGCINWFNWFKKKILTSEIRKMCNLFRTRVPRRSKKFFKKFHALYFEGNGGLTGSESFRLGSLFPYTVYK